MDGLPRPDLSGKRQTEATRLRRVYAARDNLPVAPQCASTSVANLMLVQERERHLLEQLGRRERAIDDLDCLDVGCGVGGELARLIAYGADPLRLHGIDLSDDRIASARHQLPLCDFVVGDASELPYADGSMDVVMQWTMLSSVLDEEVRASIAQEMIRVCSPSGLVVSYDFTANPTNPETRGVRPRDIRRLFPGCPIEMHRVTLAPPIARRVAPHSRHLAAFLGAIPPLRTHIIAFVTPRAG